MQLELWAPIGDAPGYEVSTWGRVRRGEELCRLWENTKGYELVELEVERRRKPLLRYVHRLVLAAFKGLPDGRFGHHRDGGKTHNALVNLEWATPAENVQHAWDDGLIPRARARRAFCVHGHPRAQPYTQRDRHGVLRTWYRCALCRRVAYRQHQARLLGFRSLFDVLDDQPLSAAD